MDNLLQDYGFYNAATGQGLPNPMNRSGNRFKKLSYSYDLISGKVNQVVYQPALQDQADPNKTNPQADAFYHRYSYDAENRLTSLETSRDNLLWTRDARYQYYRHGPLARTELGDLHVQGIDYAYTVQGWLKGINPSATGGDADGTTNLLFAKDAYTLSLNYFNGDYTPISGIPLFGQPNLISQLGTSQRQLFNGNIGSMAVNLPKLGSPILYNYGYDQLNRIVRMDAFKANDASFASLTAIQDYAERYTYDPNGNIMSLTRNGTTAQGVPMDNLSYKYIPNTNQLDHVEDAVANSGYATDITNQQAGNYAYDPIGNLVSDVSGGITGITWTVYGKIQSVAKASGTVNYTYDASGNRISKTVGATTTWYVRDATGNVMTTYTAGDNTVNSGHLTQKELDLYGSSRLGILNTNTDMTAPISAIAAYTRNQKVFELSNHLGNVLATITDAPVQVQDPANTSNVQYYNANIASANDYYVFGMAMPGRSFSAGSQYRYGFNGQEKSTEIGDGLNTAEFWEYDAATGHRWNRDQKNSPSVSPYATFFGNPILFNDVHGDSPHLGTRIMGGVKAVLWGLGAVGSGAAGAATSETGVGAALGYAGVVYSLDASSTGLKQMWTGENENTLTNQAISGGLQMAGVSPAKAQTTANYAEFGLALFLGGTSVNALTPEIKFAANATKLAKANPSVATTIITKTAAVPQKELTINTGVLQKFAEHAFAGGRHSGIGLPTDEMAAKGYNLIRQNLSRLGAGDNTLTAVINGVQTSFKAFVKNDAVQSINMYPGISNRTSQGTIINLGKITW